MDAAKQERNGRKVLYLSYDGLTDPLGRSQILPYVVGLAQLGHAMTVVSFEKPGRSTAEREAVRANCAEAGVSWHPETYHARPPVLSTLRDVRTMTRTAERLHRRQPFDFVHCRSYIAALVGLRLKLRRRAGFLFDMRGFYIDERIDMGLWRVGHPVFDRVIRYFRRREAQFLDKADAIVSLTQSGADKLKCRTDAPIAVIPCCVDFEHFRLRSPAERKQVRLELGIAADAKVLTYLGSISERMLVREMLEAFAAFAMKNGNPIFLVIATDGETLLRATARELGIAQERILFRSCSREEVPAAVSAADAGVMFYRSTEAMAGCSPTKLGEMLALGIPVLVNKGIGDVDRIMADMPAGAVANGLDEPSIWDGLKQLEARRANRADIRAAARRWFDLQSGLAAYDALYRSLSAEP